MHRTQSDLMRIWIFYLLQFNHTGFDLLSRNAPINVELGGRHGMGWGLALRYRWGIWPILFSWGRGYLNLSSPDMGIFDHWLRRKKLIPTRHFSLHSCTVQSGNQEGQRWGWKQGKLEWIWLFCLHILFYLGNLTANYFFEKCQIPTSCLASPCRLYIDKCINLMQSMVLSKTVLTFNWCRLPSITFDITSYFL